MTCEDAGIEKSCGTSPLNLPSMMHVCTIHRCPHNPVMIRSIHAVKLLQKYILTCNQQMPQLRTGVAARRVTPPRLCHAVLCGGMDMGECGGWLPGGHLKVG